MAQSSIPGTLEVQRLQILAKNSFQNLHSFRFQPLDGVHWLGPKEQTDSIVIFRFVQAKGNSSNKKCLRRFVCVCV